MKQYEKTVLVKSIVANEVEQVLNEATGVLEEVRMVTINFEDGTLPYIKSGTFEVGESKSKSYPISYLLPALKRSNSNLAAIPNLDVAKVQFLLSNGSITFLVREYEEGDSLGNSTFTHKAYRHSIIGATLNDAAEAYIKANTAAQMKAIFGF